MKILVTGGDGYLGQGIIKRLVSMGHDVVATDLSFKEKIHNSNITYIETELFSVEEPYEFFGMPDSVLHLAWRDGFIHDSKKHLEDLSMHMNFIEKLFSSDIKMISVMGSMHEVGFYEGSIDSNTRTAPSNYYGIAKDALRNLVCYLGNKTGKKYQWLRAYYIVGNTPVGSSIFSKLIDSANKGIKEFPFTTGINQFDFLDYEDFSYRVAITVTQVKHLGIINICSGQPQKLSERVESFIHENNLDIKLNYGAYPDRPYDSKAVWGNSKTIESIIRDSGRREGEEN